MNKCFTERFKVLRIEKNLKQIDLAKIFNVHKNTISSWETGFREPDFETLKKIAAFFEVPSDYLIGLTDEY